MSLTNSDKTKRMDLQGTMELVQDVARRFNSERIGNIGNQSVKQYVDGKFLSKQDTITDGAQVGMGYGICSTAAATAAKTASISNFILLTNMPVSVKFESAISVDSATLNINSTGAKPIFIQGAALQPGVVKAKDVVTLIYDGTNWNIVEILSVHVSPSDLYVDMGLPSGLLWAKANIDLTTDSKFQEVNGEISPFTYDCSFFSWGNTDGHNPISESAFDYDWGTSSSGPYASTPGAALTGDIPLSYDAAAVNCGAPWRMPSKEEFVELFNNIDCVDANGDVISGANKLVTINGIVGIRLKSKNNGNILFFPCSGMGDGQSLSYRGLYGFCWASSFYTASAGQGLGFFSAGVAPAFNNVRYGGCTIRPVQ